MTSSLVSQQASEEVERLAMQVEYRVRPVTRYIVTRFFKEGQGSGSEFKGEFDSPVVAYEVGYALAKEEHQRLGYPIADMRIKYPQPFHPLPVEPTPISMVTP